jgi:hypothetical protein
MDNEKVLIMDKGRVVSLTQFVILIVIATAVPLFHQQLVTGPIVNATLFVATILLGTQMGVFVGLIPSVIALSVGNLPAVLAPIIPFIMISNAILILTFNFFRRKNYWLAVVLASFLKFIFLLMTSSVVTGLLAQKSITKNVIMMMNYPQLLTALAGGVLAWIFLKKSGLTK